MADGNGFSEEARDLRNLALQCRHDLDCALGNLNVLARWADPIRERRADWRTALDHEAEFLRLMDEMTRRFSHGDEALLTRTELAEAIGVSPRTLDTLLRKPAFVLATGGYQSSGTAGRWHFPPEAPVNARTYLNGSRKAA